MSSATGTTAAIAHKGFGVNAATSAGERGMSSQVKRVAMCSTSILPVHAIGATSSRPMTETIAKNATLRAVVNAIVRGCDEIGIRVFASGCGCLVPPNVRANRTAAVGRLGPGWENVPRTPGRAYGACRSGSGGSARG